MNDQLFFEYLYRKISDAKKEALLDKLFDHDSNRAIQFAEKENYKIPNAKSFALKIQGKFAPDLSPDSEKNLIKVLVALKCADDQSIKDFLLGRIQYCLTSSNVQLQTIGQEALTDSRSFISKSQEENLPKMCLIG